MIDIKQKIILGNLPQKIHIRGINDSAPVLLFLHGGPGVCNRHTVMTDHSDLCEHFIVVAWDQRGSGGSYKGARAETLTVDRLVEDANELVKWLCEKFKKDKIFIIGGSWGSELGTYLTYRHPEHIAAYVGFGQVVNGARNEEISYNFAMEEAKKAGDEKAIKILEKVGPPVMGVYNGGFEGMMAQRRIMMKYGGYSKNEKKRNYFSSMVVPMIKSHEYSIADFIGVAKGYKYVLTAMWPDKEGRHARNGAGHLPHAKEELERLLRRKRCGRSSLSPSGRSGNAVLYYGRWRKFAGPDGYHSSPRHARSVACESR